jgi:hypothetical protein
MTEKDYPEHQKLQAVKDKSQAIYDFVEWLNQKGYAICEKVEYEKEEFRLTDKEAKQWKIGWDWMRANLNFEKTLAEFFDIDLNKLEAEKRALLDYLREQNERRPV